MFGIRRKLKAVERCLKDVQYIKKALEWGVGLDLDHWAEIRNPYSRAGENILCKISDLEDALIKSKSDNEKEIAILRDRIWKLENPPKFSGMEVEIKVDSLGLEKGAKVKLVQPVFHKKDGSAYSLTKRSWRYTALKDCDIWRSNVEEDSFKLPTKKK